MNLVVTVLNEMHSVCWQTPTKVTFEILALTTVEAQLNAYCAWARERGADDEHLKTVRNIMNLAGAKFSYV